MKRKHPRSNNQHPEEFQAPESKFALGRGAWILVLGSSLDFACWILDVYFTWRKALEVKTMDECSRIEASK